MSIKTLFSLILTIISLFYSGLSDAATSTTDAPKSAQALARQCAGCHGPKGHSQMPENPKLAQQNQRYFIQQMLVFQKGEQGGRMNQVMMGIANQLTKQQIEKLAHFYARQSIKPGEVAPKYVHLGERIYRGGLRKQHVPACMACHGPKGQGNPQAGFPLIGGQHAEYLLSQLEAYHQGKRSSDQNAMMRDISQHLTERQMRAVAHYIEGLH